MHFEQMSWSSDLAVTKDVYCHLVCNMKKSITYAEYGTESTDEVFFFILALSLVVCFLHQNLLTM